MSKITLDQIKQLRSKTRAGVMDCRKALQQAFTLTMNRHRNEQGKLDLAEKILKEREIQQASKRGGRETSQGIIEAYTHNDGKIVSVVELLCETDFVAKTDEFKRLAHELAMQVAAMNPKNINELLQQPWIRDEKMAIEELVKETVGKLQENIVVRRIARFELGEE